MLITTTPTLQNRVVLRYLGLVCGEATLALRRPRLRSAEPAGGAARDWPGELDVQCVREAAIAGMCAQAEQLGANAIVAVDLDFERLGGRLLLVCASGTAVIYAEAAAVSVEAATQPDRLDAWQALRLPLPAQQLRTAPAAGRWSRCRW